MFDVIHDDAYIVGARARRRGLNIVSPEEYLVLKTKTNTTCDYRSQRAPIGPHVLRKGTHVTSTEFTLNDKAHRPCLSRGKYGYRDASRASASTFDGSRNRHRKSVSHILTKARIASKTYFNVFPQIDRLTFAQRVLRCRCVHFHVHTQVQRTHFVRMIA